MEEIVCELQDIYTLSTDGQKLIGFTSEGTLAYQDITPILSGTKTSGKRPAVSPDGKKLYGFNSSTIVYKDTSSITESYTRLATSYNYPIVASKDYVYDSLTSRQKIIDIQAGTPDASGTLTVSLDGTQIIGFDSNHKIVYQETSEIHKGTVSTKMTISPDGSKMYGFDLSNQLIFQDIKGISEGTCSNSNPIFVVKNSHRPTLAVVLPVSKQTYTTSNPDFAPTINVSDTEGLDLTVKYTIDQETEERESKVVKETKSPQTPEFSSLDLESLSNGTHRILFEVSNGSTTSSSSLTFVVKKEAPSILGSGSLEETVDYELTNGVVLPNGYKGFLDTTARKVTVFKADFGKVNSFSPTFTDGSSGITYSLDSSRITLIARPNNTFALFGEIRTSGTSSGTKIGYMIILPSGSVTDAKIMEDDSDYSSSSRFIACGVDRGAILCISPGDFIRYLDSNFETKLNISGDFPLNYTYEKLTGKYCAKYSQNSGSYSILDLENGQKVIASSLPNDDDTIGDIVSRSDGTTLISYRRSSSESYIRVLNTDFTVKQDIRINPTSKLTHLVPLNDNSVLMTFGPNYSLLGKGNTLDPVVYTLQAPASGEISSAEVFNNGEIVLTDESKEAFESITYYKAPIVTIVSPTSEQQLSETDLSFIPSISVSDTQNHKLTCKYYLDFETVPRDTKTVVNTLSKQTVKFSPFNVKALPVGSHSIKIEVSNGDNTYRKTVGFVVSELAPTLGTVTTTSTEKSITVNGDASPKVLALHGTPFRYTIGTNVSEWITAKTYTQNSLTPNTLYLVKFEARDRLETTANSAQNVYTKAITPSSVTLSGSTSTTLDMTIADTNPSTTQYQISTGTSYLGSNGLLSDSPTWITVNDKQITICGLTPLTGYSFKVKARNGAGIETAQKGSNLGTTLASPASSPQNIGATSTSTSLTITWDAVTGATGYDVEQDNVVADNGTSTTRTITGLTPGTQYIYRVRARFSTGLGSWSSLKTLSTQPDSPDVPANLATSATSNSITVTWTAVVGALGYDIQADGSVIDNGTNKSYTQSGLNPDTEHKYRVRATLVTGDGAWTNYVTKKTLPYASGVPVNLTVSATDTKSTVSWDSIAGVVGYDIEVDGKVLDNGTNVVFEHSNLIAKTVHNYRVRARKSTGTSGWSEKVTVTTYAYSVPADSKASAFSTYITLNWDAVTGATGYELMADGVLVKTGTNITYTHSNLRPDTQHTYQVRATGPNGTSSWSPVITKSIAADKVPVNVITLSTDSKIIVTWSAVSGAVGYDVDVDGSIISNGTATSYTDTNPDDSVLHSYKVRSKTSTSTSGWSTTVSASILPTSPLVPTGITKSVSYSTVRLSWAAVAGALGYDVKVDEVIKDNGASTTYLHSGLGSNTTHTYLVRAKNTSGVGPWSPTVSATTSTVSYSVNCTLNEQFNLMLTAADVSDLDQKKFVVTYDPDELGVVDLCSNTLPADLALGTIKDTDITIVEFIAGKIVFTLDRIVDPKKLWSGPINSIGFKSKVTGQTVIKYNIQSS